MIQILLSKLSKIHSINVGLNPIVIMDKAYYRNVYYMFEDELIISQNNRELKKNEIVIIRNPLDIDLNDKKGISGLFNNLIVNIKRNHRDEWNKIITDFIKIVNISAADIGADINYDVNMSSDKMFQAINLLYSRDNPYIQNVINYIEHILDSYKIELFCFFNMKSILTDNEYDQLAVEFEKKGIKVVDFIPELTEIKRELAPLYIDEDLCII